MAKPVVLITGANGFMGTALVNHFVAQGWQVVGLVRDPSRFKKAGVRYVSYDLQLPYDESIFDGADYLIHAAYIKQDSQNPHAFQANVTAAERLAASARSHKLKKALFVSSMSAHEGAESVYGRQKLAIEKVFKGPGFICLRPGFVVGRGGIVQGMVDFIKQRGVVPLVGGGRQPLQIVGIKDLVKAIEAGLRSPATGIFTIATPEVYTYKQFYQALARHLKIKVRFVPVPIGLLLGVLKVAGWLRLPVPVSKDNVLGLKNLIAVETQKDLDKLDVKVAPLEAALKTNL